MLADTPRAGDVAHVTLRLGRLMLVNGADTTTVRDAVTSFAQQFGYDVHLLVLFEGIVLTLKSDAGLLTKLGSSVSGPAVNMGALAELEAIRMTTSTTGDVSEIDRRLEQVERSGNHYPGWLVMLGMGFTAASLARLFGGDWSVVGVSVVVGIVTQWLRQHLGNASSNPIASAALAAFGGGLVGALFMKTFPSASPTLCLVAAGMILVPGVPLINGVRDVLGGHAGPGIAHLLVGTITVLSIALGLFVAANVAFDVLPVDGGLPLLPVAEDFLFSALAGFGFALLFNVPMRAAWACGFCSMAGHGLRTAIQHLGVDLTLASLAGAFAATGLARLVGYRYDVPAVTFAFPGVVAMIPGSYAFRAGVGGLAIMHAGSGASAGLIGQTMGLAVTAVLVTAAIAIGLVLALAVITFPSTKSRRAEAKRNIG